MFRVIIKSCFPGKSVGIDFASPSDVHRETQRTHMGSRLCQEKECQIKQMAAPLPYGSSGISPCYGAVPQDKARNIFMLLF